MRRLRLSLTAAWAIAALFTLVVAEAQTSNKAGGMEPAGVSFAPTITQLSPILYPQSIAAGDLNHSGRAGLGVVGDEVGYLCTAAEWLSDDLSNWDCNGPAGDAGEQVIFADLNLDGNLDEVTTDADLPIVTVGYGNGEGQFPKGLTLHVHCGYSTQGVAVADLNGDGIPDIVATVLGAGDNPGCLAIFLGQGGGKFAKAQDISSGGSVAFSVAVGDLNHDGIPDLVVANFGTEQNGDYGNISVLLGNGDGTFQKPIRYFGLRDPTQVILADFNNDGNLDAAAIALGKHEIYVFLGRATARSRIR